MHAAALRPRGAVGVRCRVSHLPAPAPQPHGAPPLTRPRAPPRRRGPRAASALGPEQQQQLQQQRQAPPPPPPREVRARALALSPPQPPPPEPRGGGAPPGVAALAGGAGPGDCVCPCGSLGWNANFWARFDVGAEVGRGSFGVVHVATHRGTGEQYAVKVLRKCPGGGSSSSSSSGGGSAGSGGGTPAPPATPGATAGAGGAVRAGALAASDDEPCCVEPDPTKLEAIEREVQAWMSVQGSQYVARLHGLYEDADNAYLVQELIGGGTIKSLLEARSGRLGEAEAATVMRGVLDVLCECHRRDICYGDVKPANFLVMPGSGDGKGGAGVSVRAVDFGCSRHVPLTKPCGSPLFMAPEMITHGHRRFGTAVDIWAAGVMLYQLLTGKLPFWTNMTPAEVGKLPPYSILGAVRTHDVSYPRDLWADVSPEARDLVASMLDRSPPGRVTAHEALAHPWFARALGYAPRPSGVEKELEEAGEIEFSARIAALHL